MKIVRRYMRWFDNLKEPTRFYVFLCMSVIACVVIPMLLSIYGLPIGVGVLVGLSLMALLLLFRK